MEKKFIKLIESNITRATRGGFLVGDYVEFVKNYKSNPEYKELHDNMKEAIDELIKGKLNVRVIGINDVPALRFPGNPDSMTGNVVLSLAQDQGGGRIYGNVLVPVSLCKVVDHYPNYAPFPAEFSYDNKEIHKPEEVKSVDSGMKGVTYALPTTNQTLNSSKPKKKKKVQKESYTSQYLDGMEHLR